MKLKAISLIILAFTILTYSSTGFFIFKNHLTLKLEELEELIVRDIRTLENKQTLERLNDKWDESSFVVLDEGFEEMLPFLYAILMSQGKLAALNSPGGFSVVSTWVASLLNNTNTPFVARGYCASACAFAAVLSDIVLLKGGLLFHSGRHVRALSEYKGNKILIQKYSDASYLIASRARVDRDCLRDNLLIQHRHYFKFVNQHDFTQFFKFENIGQFHGYTVFRYHDSIEERACPETLPKVDTILGSW